MMPQCLNDPTFMQANHSAKQLLIKLMLIPEYLPEHFMSKLRVIIKQVTSALIFFKGYYYHPTKVSVNCKSDFIN